MNFQKYNELPFLLYKVMNFNCNEVNSKYPRILFQSIVYYTFRKSIRIRNVTN